MLTVAYLSNQFPSPVEPYVVAEIAQLRRRGIRIIPGTVRKPNAKKIPNFRGDKTIVIESTGPFYLLSALNLCVRRGTRIFDLLARILFKGGESPLARIKALIHTFLGACYAAQLKPLKIDHIHVHHGYFGSWIGLVAARLLGVEYSLTLHGSDLLLHGAYLDTKLEESRFCLTVSAYHREHILNHYPGIDASKVIVARLGVPIPARSRTQRSTSLPLGNGITIVAVGRLHQVKDHAFLLRSCAQLRARGLRFECLIAGTGPEQGHLKTLIRKYGLQEMVSLLGHVPHHQVSSLYDRADVVVLTSRSEGVPLVLMEAMARGQIVLAPLITGIPELVISEKTGFLYRAGSQGDFVARILLIVSYLAGRKLQGPSIPSAMNPLDWMRHGARIQVRDNFNQQTNLEYFADLFSQRISAKVGSFHHEDFVLQQV
ncbi:MAG TPA: glycosyltransferase family 4 protein [Candidatus Sulfotelmatobacter sp.]